MPVPVTTDLGLEIVATLSGKITPAEPDVGIMWPDVEDPDIEDLRYESRQFIGATYGTNSHGSPTELTPPRWGPTTSTSLLEGVDIKNTEVQKLLGNIIKVLGKEVCTEALLEAGAE